MVECPRCHTLNSDDEDAYYCKRCREPLPKNKGSRRSGSTGLCDGKIVPRSGGF